MDPLWGRLVKLGIGFPVADRLVADARAASDPSAIAALDAAARSMERRPREARQQQETDIQNLQGCLLAGRCDDPSLEDPTLWTARSPSNGSDHDQTVILRGALMLQVHGKLN